MKNYILRNIDPTLWARVKARAQLDHMPLRAVILKLLDRYAHGTMNITATEDPQTQAHLTRTR